MEVCINWLTIHECIKRKKRPFVMHPFELCDPSDIVHFQAFFVPLPSDDDDGFPFLYFPVMSQNAYIEMKTIFMIFL